MTTGQQRNMASKVCARVWEALSELDEDCLGDGALEEALLQVREKLQDNLPFGPGVGDIPTYN